MDDELFGGLGDVPLQKQVGLQGLKIPGVLLPVVPQQGEPLRRRQIPWLQNGLDGVQHMVQGAVGEGEDPLLVPAVEGPFQGDVRLTGGLLQRLDPIDRSGYPGVQAVVPAQRGQPVADLGKAQAAFRQIQDQALLPPQVHDVAAGEETEQVAVEHMAQDLGDLLLLALKPDAEVGVLLLPFQGVQQKPQVPGLRLPAFQQGADHIVQIPVLQAPLTLLLAHQQHGPLGQALGHQIVQTPEGPVGLEQQEPPPVALLLPQVHIQAPAGVRGVGPELAPLLGVGPVVVGVEFEFFQHLPGDQTFVGAGEPLRRHDLHGVLGHGD